MRLWIVLGALVAFAVAYNRFIAWAERTGYIEGYVSLFVAFGVFATLGGLYFISPHAARLALFCFFASGIPMIIGSVWRYMRQRAQGQERLGQERLGMVRDDQSEGMA